LRGRSAPQARLEYRLAQQQGLPFPISFAELVPLAHDYTSAVEMALPERPGVPLLNYVVVAVRQSLPASTVMIDDEILRRDPNNREALERRANAVWNDVEDGEASPWCSGNSECVVRAEQTAQRVQEVAPESCDGYAIEARALVATGRTADGLRKLRQSLDLVTDWPTCDATLATLAIAAGDESTASRAIEALAKRPCAREEDCISNLLGAAALETSRGSPHRALVYLRRADELAPARQAIQKAAVPP